MSHRRPGQEPGAWWVSVALRAALLALAGILVWAAATTTITPLSVAAYIAAAAVLLAELARSTLT